MRLLLDEHFRPEIAGQLRGGFGHDVVAVLERPALVGKGDATLLEAARAERRAVVTENVKDFSRLQRYALVEEETHFGIIFASPRRFARPKGATGRLVLALDELLRKHPDDGELVNRALWLEPA